MLALSLRGKVVGKPSDYSEGLSLIIPENIESAALPIGWCVTSDVVERLRPKRNAESPYLLISVGTYSQDPNNPSRRLLQEKYRRLVPLEQGMEYVDLFFEGGTYIAASIVVGRKSKLREEYLSWKDSSSHYRETDYTKYENQLIEPFLRNNGDESWQQVFYRSRSTDVGSSLVFFEVPKGVFAEKPWDYKWLTLLLGTPRDQCSMRGWRRLFAYTLQPIFFSLVFLVVLLVICVRCFSLGILWILGFWDACRLHLLEFDWEEVRLSPRYRGENVYREALSRGMRFLSSRVSSLQKLESEYSSWRHQRDAEKAEKARLLKESNRSERERQLDFTCDTLQTKLTCAVDSQSEVTIHPGRETLTLKYQALKAQVCRPFSQEK